MQRLSKKIAKWLTETAQKETTNGQYYISFEEIRGQFDLDISEIDEALVNEILGCMDPEIVADVITDEEGFDLDLYLDFCPNWDGN